MLDEKIVSMLVCPKTKAALKQVGDELICEESGLAYPIYDGIPILLIDKARDLTKDKSKK